jgi:hypothetical protein
MIIFTRELEISWFIEFRSDLHIWPPGAPLSKVDKFGPYLDHWIF